MKDLFDFANSPTMKFEEAIKYFGDKIPLTPKEFYDLADKYKSLAFTVSNYSKAGVLNRFYETLLKALEDGTSIQQFKKDMDTFLVDTGYKGLTPFQADNIFRTNIQTAYQVGHYKVMTNPQVLKLRPYWQYDAVDDIRLEAITQEGELFYDTSYGWSLLDFLQSTDDELTRVEIKQRIQNKLSSRDIVDSTSIVVSMEFKDETILLNVKFNILDSAAQLIISIDRVSAEVVIV